MNIHAVKIAFLIITLSLILNSVKVDYAHAVIIEPFKIPEQGELSENAEKDIPRLEWVAGRNLQKGRFLKTIEICQNILEFNQDNLKAKAYLAAAYKGIGDEKKFQVSFDALKKQHPDSADIYLGVVWTCSALGNLKNAESICKQGIKTSSKPQALMMELAELFLKQGRVDDAKVQYIRVLDIKNLSTKIFLNANFTLCRIGLDQKRYDEVIKRGEMLIKLYPPLPQSYKFLSDAYIGKKEYEKAVEVYQKLTKANPESETSFQEIALIYNDLIKDSKNAILYAQKGMEKFPENPKTMDIYGWVLYSNQEYLKALKQFKAAIKISENNPWFYYHAGMAHQKLEDKSNAVKNYQKALELLKNRSAKDFKNQIEKLIAQCQ
jgi:tetratricopeptide (TPR) repeat protein